MIYRISEIDYESEELIYGYYSSLKLAREKLKKIAIRESKHGTLDDLFYQSLSVHKRRKTEIKLCYRGKDRLDTLIFIGKRCQNIRHFFITKIKVLNK